MQEKDNDFGGSILFTYLCVYTRDETFFIPQKIKKRQSF